MVDELQVDPPLVTVDTRQLHNHRITNAVFPPRPVTNQRLVVSIVTKVIALKRADMYQSLDVLSDKHDKQPETGNSGDDAVKLTTVTNEIIDLHPHLVAGIGIVGSTFIREQRGTYNLDAASMGAGDNLPVTGDYLLSAGRLTPEG